MVHSTKNDNYAQLFLEQFNYRKTRIFTNNKTLSSRLDEEATALRLSLKQLAENDQHTLADVIQIVTKAIENIRTERDKHVQSTEKVSRHTHDSKEACSRCDTSLTRRHYQVTPTFFAYKPASFERKTAYAMYRISRNNSEANGMIAAIQEAFKTLCFKLGLWTPKTVPQNESIDQFLKWMNGLKPKKSEGQTTGTSTLDGCNSSTCNPVGPDSWYYSSDHQHSSYDYGSHHHHHNDDYGSHHDNGSTHSDFSFD